MRIRRIVSHAALDDLEPVFAKIRKDAGIRDGYSQEAYFEAEHGGGEDDPSHVVGTRIDRTDLPVVTIDPVGSRDLDQALHIESRDDGFRVFYAIADVASHVLPGGPLDFDTKQRVETIYSPDKRIGLHPPTLSEGYASLLPGQRTKAALWTIDIDANGERTHAKVERAWVRSRHQYSYPQLQDDAPPEAAELVRLLAKVGHVRRSLMRSRGAVTLPKPSQEVVVKNGLVDLEFEAARPIEDDNAQISLLTGETAAGMMLEAGHGILRTMPPVTSRALARLRRQATGIGVEWPDDVDYAGLLDSLDTKNPRTAAFLTQAVTLFRGAMWQSFDDRGDLPRPENLVHGALAAPYAHVTAPLRRLVDRYGTEICIAHSLQQPTPQWVAEALPWIGKEMARGSRLAKKVDRGCTDAVESAMLRPFVGQKFEAVGLDRDTVQVADPAVVAKCTGNIRIGKRQHVTLNKVDGKTGPKFAA